MHLVPIEQLERKDIRKMKRLNREAFPKVERIPFDKLAEVSKSDQFDFLAIKADELFIGFFLIAKNKGDAYLMFFAIAKRHRAKGYGGPTLIALQEYYPSKQIVLDLEEMADDEPNIKQREAKKEFYKRTGFMETGYNIHYANKHFELLCNKETFNKESFRTLLDEIKDIVNTIKAEKFEPVITEK
ncbi:GNAT family N-acetyltransferase [Alkalibacterium sp. f15]|uniref:GNAT family N-acetyltransferase n=1 Tax=Alkalibacterium sp. f15 TaxID=3414029 RepID=UPI003BF91157